MSAATQNIHEDVKPAVPVFSYAQAAKGKPTPSVPAASTGSKAVSEPGETDVPKSEAAKVKPSPDSKAQSTPGTLNEVPTIASELSKSGQDIRSVTESGRNESQTNHSSPKGSQAGPLGHAPATNTDIPDSPQIDASANTQNQNGESAANYVSSNVPDKSANASQNETGVNGKDGLQSADEASWTEERASNPALKEAPPPPINFWAQRMAQAPKPKAQQSVSTQTPKPTPPANGQANDSTTPSEANGEAKRQENKRRPRNVADDRSAAKEGARSTDGKGKPAEGVPKATTGSMAPPPPPGDAVSWPTPDSAHDEDRKKPQEKPEKEKAQVAKPHGKKEWQQLPFVPSVAWNTPLPLARRGGRSQGNTRDGGNRGRNNAAPDKAASNGTSPTSQTPAQSEDRGKSASASTVPSNPQRSKRASSAGPATLREQRKVGEPMGGDKRRDFDNAQTKAPVTKGSGQPEPRRQSGTFTNESQSVKGSAGRPPHRDSLSSARKIPSSSVEDVGQAQPVGSNTQSFRPNEHERRNENFAKPAEVTKDSQPVPSSRDRGDGRADRGRGGFRGRGGGNQNMHNGFSSNGHGYSNPYSQFQPNPGNQTRSFSNHERLGSQQPTPFYVPGPPMNRHNRSNSRSQSIQQPFGRFSHTAHAGPPHLTNLQTDLANTFAFQPEPQGPMSAIPFNTFLPPPNLFGMVTVQMEYYFSVDNLCKDTFLRSQMNSQGFVPLALVAGFRRIQQLTPDLELVRYVCLNSQIIEFRLAEDGTDWIRRRDDWQQWVLNMEERVASARNDGPPPASPYPNSQMTTTSPPVDERHSMSPRSNATTAAPDTLQYQPLENPTPTMNQIANMPALPPNGLQNAAQVPLSAAVSEFSPSVRSPSNRVFSSPDPQTQGINMVSDEEMDKLNITFRAKPTDVAAPTLPPFHSASSRTFSNGSIDASAISNELTKFAEQQARPSANGDMGESAEIAPINRSRSPFSLGSPGRKAGTTSAPSVLWFKDKEQQARMNSLPSEYTHAPYPAFRQSALGQRERLPNDPCVYDMQVLYDFWAHYLIRNFNPSTYQEFKRLAVEDDSGRNSNFGMRNLLQYYDEALLGQRTIPDDLIANDFVEFVQNEARESDRPLFRKLRAAWRNGAFSHKNRAKIIRSIGEDLKGELDR